MSATSTVLLEPNSEQPRCHTPTPDDDVLYLRPSTPRPTEDDDDSDKAVDFNATISRRGRNRSFLNPLFVLQTRKRSDSVETIREPRHSQAKNTLQRVPSSFNLAALADASAKEDAGHQVVPNPDDIPEIPDEDRTNLYAFPTSNVPAEQGLGESLFGRKRVPFRVPHGPWLSIPPSLWLEKGVQNLTRNGIIPERFDFSCRPRPKIATSNHETTPGQCVKVDEEKPSRVEFGVQDLAVEVLMYEKYYDIWDAELHHENLVLIPARMLVVTREQSDLIADVPIAPDIRLLDIRCRSFNYPGLTGDPPVHSADVNVGYNEASSLKAGMFCFERGICIRPFWRKLSRRVVMPRRRVGPKGRDAFEAQRRSRKDPECGDEDCDYEAVGADEGSEPFDTEMCKNGWYMKFWIPIPMEFLRLAGTKAFRIEAAAWIGEEIGGGLLVGQADFVVSALQFGPVQGRK